MSTPPAIESATRLDFFGKLCYNIKKGGGIMTQKELFMLANSLKRHALRKQWDDVEAIIDDTLWATADKDWRESNKHLFEKTQQNK